MGKITVEGKGNKLAMSPAWGSSGGVVTMWKDEIVEGMEELIGRFNVSIKFKQRADGFECVLTNTYGPTRYRERSCGRNWRMLDGCGMGSGAWVGTSM